MRRGTDLRPFHHVPGSRQLRQRARHHPNQLGVLLVAVNLLLVLGTLADAGNAALVHVP